MVNGIRTIYTVGWIKGSVQSSVRDSEIDMKQQKAEALWI